MLLVDIGDVVAVVNRDHCILPADVHHLALFACFRTLVPTMFLCTNLQFGMAFLAKLMLLTADNSNGTMLCTAQAQLFLFSLSLFFTPGCSRLVNITVDDSFGDPTTGVPPQYSGTTRDQWNAGSPTSSDNCTNCVARPASLDLNQVYKQTWHDSAIVYNTRWSITIQFTGSAVYVFNILPNTLRVSSPSSVFTVNADIIFQIDGEDVFHFARIADYSNTILYNQLVYSNTSLDHGPHTLTMTPGGSSDSAILFDYLIYTTESDDTTSTVASVIPSHSSSQSPKQPPSPPQSPGTNSPPSLRSPSTTPVGALAGLVLGATALLLGVAAGVFFLRRRYKRRTGTPTRVGPEDTLRHEDEYGRDGDCEEQGAEGTFLEQRMVDLGSQTTAPAISPPLQLVDGANTHIPLTMTSDLQLCGPDSALHTSVRATVAGSSARPSESMVDQSTKRQAALTERLDVLHRTRSLLSSQTPSDSRGSRSEFEVSSED